MGEPLETLKKMLTLEKQDYGFQDRAVAGGLVRYVGTWRKQATQAYSAERLDWVAEVAQGMAEYSAGPAASRPERWQCLWDLLAPGEAAPEARVVAPPPAPVAAAPRKSPLAGQGLRATTDLLPGVGEKRAQLLAKIGAQTIGDLLALYPHRYEDYSQLKTIDHLKYGERVTLLAAVWEAGVRETRSGRSLFHAILSDDTGTLEVTWFNQPYLQGSIKPGMQLRVRGKVDEYLGRLTMNSPQWERLGRDDLGVPQILPIYPLTEGLSANWLRKLMRQTLSTWAARLPDPLPKYLRQKQQLLSAEQALWGIHFPQDDAQLKAARRRLVFEETLYLQLGLLSQKQQWRSVPGREVKPPLEYLTALAAALPYGLTAAQRRSLNEMMADLASGRPMNRLLQGDVGAGKTVVAAILMAMVTLAGYQAAMMAPTEILAEQHYRSLYQLFAVFPEPHPELRLLTGSVSREDRVEIYAGLADGAIQIVVGTHALIQEAVEFDELALVVVDEQHRFGVEQRAALRQKGYNPHLLAMTATPIPRSLELTLWGHLDVSVLDELPPGRQPIQTRVLAPRQRERAYSFICKEVAQGRQAFIIYPLVEESEKIEARAAVVEYERLQKEVFPDLRVGLLHGRMRGAEKEARMSAFVRGELDVLVATSVVEVGVDVPNATVMLIDGAERFGLSQLHQFRGRVGRGAQQSYCLLLAQNASERAAERLQALEATNDGFVLAEKDLAMRGPGEFLGTRQSGFPELPLAMQARDTRLLHEVREVAQALLAADSDLSRPEHRGLARRVAELWNPRGLAGDVS
ncbi:MAG: ATP-dependent DNA helicase RecG [Chloroflexota bacterium]|nr:ATP-dependent DNA helicase RecG [Chloroflexota bacterium]